MAITILIPTALRQFTDNLSEIEVENSQTVNEALENLVTEYSDLKRHLFTEEGTLRSFVNVYIGEDDIRELNGVDTKLKEDETLILVPSIAGGV
ncbi:MAG: MoaD/ThiS family protein [Clostridiaceae bacterium]